MKNKTEKFYDFLNDIKYANPACFEAVTKAYNRIFDILEEATEEKVKELKDKHPEQSEEKLPPTEEFIEDLEDEGEIPPEEELGI